jgi:hypothetical protein
MLEQMTWDGDNLIANIWGTYLKHPSVNQIKYIENKKRMEIECKEKGSWM